MANPLKDNPVKAVPLRNYITGEVFYDSLFANGDKVKRRMVYYTIIEVESFFQGNAL